MSITVLLSRLGNLNKSEEFLSCSDSAVVAAITGLITVV